MREDLHVLLKLLLVLYLLVQEVGLQTPFLHLPQRLAQQEFARLSYYLFPERLVYLREPELSQVFVSDSMLVFLPQQEMQDFFGAHFGTFEYFPKFYGSFDVVLLGVFDVGQHYGVFESNGQMFLKVMKGGRIDAAVRLVL
jgi:hypothetical protein